MLRTPTSQNGKVQRDENPSRIFAIEIKLSQRQNVGDSGIVAKKNE